MTVAKLFAAAFCGSVIAFQAYPILSGQGYNNYYWPFVNYPMYSDSHRMGDSVSSIKMRAVPCRSGAPSVAVTEVDLRIKWGTFDRLLDEAAGLRETTSPVMAERASRRLRQLAATELPIPTCAVQLWRRTITIGPRGLENADAAWRVAAEWPVTEADSLPAGLPDLGKRP
jgi:hypothetical protein